MSKSLQSQIYELMNAEPHGEIYTNSDFSHLGNSDAVRQALSRLSEEDKIRRLIDGYYTKPYFSDLLQEYGHPSVDQLAEKIADKFSWTICPSGNNALNLIGLSTQVPSEYVYVSDGPYRTYEYNNRTIVFKHTSNRYVTEYSKNLSLVIQAIKSIDKNNITEKDIKRLAKFCKKNIEKNILENVKKIPVWIQEIFKKISKEMEQL